MAEPCGLLSLHPVIPLQAITLNNKSLPIVQHVQSVVPASSCLTGHFHHCLAEQKPEPAATHPVISALHLCTLCDGWELHLETNTKREAIGRHKTAINNSIGVIPFLLECWIYECYDRFSSKAALMM